MKYILILFISLSATCLNAQKLRNLPPPPPPPSGDEDEKCYYNGKLSVKDRRAKYPFSKADTVKIISFDSYEERAPIVHDTVNYAKVFENIVLSNEEIDSLTNVLFNYGYSPKTMITMDVQTGCYSPRQAIVFLNKASHVMAYIEICFECRQVQSNLPRRTYGIFCQGKYELIKDFFVSMGITHFTDTGKDPNILEPIIAEPDIH